MESMSVFLVALMIIPFMLFILRIVLISWHNMLLARQLKEEEGRQCTQVSVVNGSQDAGNAANSAAMKNDLPPSYDDAVQNYIYAKQALQTAEEGAVGGGLAMAAPSTVTIDTIIDDNVSANVLNAVTTTAQIVTCPAVTSNDNNNNACHNNNNNC